MSDLPGIDGAVPSAAEQTGSDRSLLDACESVGDGAEFEEQIMALVGRSQFFSECNREDVELLASCMLVYRARAGQTLLCEGGTGDHMLLIIEGDVDIYKTKKSGEQQHLTFVSAGKTLGEMSMIDGEPRFATCAAVNTVMFGVLTRENMVHIIFEKPSLGAKILIKLVIMLSQRLRQTSAKLLQYVE
jgi:CRP/FNR family cyclic AMP-dependent transcriptional regulator